MNLNRLDNKRLPSIDTVQNPTPMVSISKSYARFNNAALAELNILAGKDYLGFGQGPDSDKYVVYKAADEKSGKLVTKDSTIVSQSIYKRLEANTNYELVAVPNEKGCYFLEKVEEEAEEEVAQSTMSVATDDVPELTNALEGDEQPESAEEVPTPEADSVEMPNPATFGAPQSTTTAW